MLFPGLLRPKGGAGPEFTPLLRTSDAGGPDLLVARPPSRASWGSPGSTPAGGTSPSDVGYTLAARVKGAPRRRRPKPAADPAKKDEAKKAEAKPADDQRDRHRRPRHDLRAVLRAAAAEDREPRLRQRDVRAQLRRRPGRRRVVRRPPQEAARATARSTAIEDADQGVHRRASGRDQGGRGRRQGASSTTPRSALDKQVDQVRAGKDLDERTKEIMLGQPPGGRQPPARRREGEDRGREARPRSTRARPTSEQKIRAIQNRVRYLAIAAIPPLPPLVLGLFVFVVRLRRENQGANPNRLAA